MTPYAARVEKLGTENAFKIGDDIQRCEKKGMKVIKLNLGDLISLDRKIGVRIPGPQPRQRIVKAYG